MAVFARFGKQVLQHNPRLLHPLCGVRWTATGPAPGEAGSLENTLNVKERIEMTRNKALLGGGQNRIDAQHKKVNRK